MTTRFAVAALALLLGACAVTPLPDSARVGVGAFGSNQDPEMFAINLSSWAFALPSRTRDDPANAARAVASVDYLAGDLYANPRFQYISPVFKQQMLDARVEVRQALGIVQNAPSQSVVDRLLAAGGAMATANRPAALAALDSPAFTYGPERTLAVLADLPWLPAANVASLHVSNAFERVDDRCGFGCS